MEDKKKKPTMASQILNILIQNHRKCNWFMEPKSYRASSKWFEFQNTIRISTIFLWKKMSTIKVKSHIVSSK